VLYRTPSAGGFRGAALYAFGEVSGQPSAGRMVELQGEYANGPLDIVLTHQNVKGAVVPLATTSATSLGGFYDFAVVKAYAHFATIKGDNGTGLTTTDARDLLIGVLVPIGTGNLMASYVRKDDRLPAHNDATQVGIGYDYSLSKRTALYTSYASITNHNGANYTYAAGGNKLFNVGIRHSF
jgi:predicted porin